jgi:hypothetical protein
VRTEHSTPVTFESGQNLWDEEACNQHAPPRKQAEGRLRSVIRSELCVFAHLDVRERTVGTGRARLLLGSER